MKAEFKIKNIIMIILGGAVMGFALEFLLVPAKIAAGGVSGVATILYYLFRLPVGVMVFVINIPIFMIGMKEFSWRFLLTSIIGTAAMSGAAQFFELDFFQKLLPLSEDIFLCSVLGGAIYGAGLGITIRAGGTTGGTDIVSLVLKKKFPNFSVGQLIIFIDGAVIAAAGIAFKSMETILYSAVLLFVSSYVLDTMLAGVDFAKIVYIISEKNADISKAISERISRGSTALNGHSYYSGMSRDVLMCVMRKYQVPPLKQLVTEIDPTAFVIVTDAKEVIGEGFRYDLKPKEK